MPRRYTSRELRESKIRVMNMAGQHCENCGLFIPIVRHSNFAHWRGKNVTNRDEILNDISFVCQELHWYEHKRSNNLKNHPCVSYYLDRYGDHFWEPFCLEKYGETRYNLYSKAG